VRRRQEGCQWKALPRECGSASSAHEHFRARKRCGVFVEMWRRGLAEYVETKVIASPWQSIDGAMVETPLALEAAEPIPQGLGVFREAGREPRGTAGDRMHAQRLWSMPGYSRTGSCLQTGTRKSVRYMLAQPSAAAFSTRPRKSARRHASTSRVMCVSRPTARSCRSWPRSTGSDVATGRVSLPVRTTISVLTESSKTGGSRTGRQCSRT